jgi:hypothetical protein
MRLYERSAKPNAQVAAGLHDTLSSGVFQILGSRAKFCGQRWIKNKSKEAIGCQSPSCFQDRGTSRTMRSSMIQAARQPERVAQADYTWLLQQVIFTATTSVRNTTTTI